MARSIEAIPTLPIDDRRREEPGEHGPISTTVEARALLIAGRPLGEPIEQYGPFVMNTKQEIYQAVNDYRAGRLDIGPDNNGSRRQD